MKVMGHGPFKNERWPNVLNLRILHQNCPAANPLKEFDYASEFENLNLLKVKKDILKIMNTSQDWWPADYGNYGPLFVRLAWHSSGTYRIQDGRGGANRGIIRLWPVRSWPDNVNLDKAIRLLWPVKKKYGRRISWADLIILAGTVALESMGFETIGFAGGREDVFEPQDDIYWGSEEEWLESHRFKDEELEAPLAATQMGLIYVNPEGPGGEPNPLKSAERIRLAFRRMGMNDEETVALIAGGHTFGKCHGAAPTKYVDPEPDAAPIENQGLGWKNDYGEGKGKDTISSGLEGAWTPTPTKWDTEYLRILFKYDWNLEKSPAGAWQWVPTDPETENMVPDAHDNARHKPIMLTSDLALRYDFKYAKIARKFLENPEEFRMAFARAWFKLTHRDMGPPSRYLGNLVPEERFVWQEPLPAGGTYKIKAEKLEFLKREILNSGLKISEMVYTAWSAASTFRGSDFKGGANGARIRLDPQRAWEVNMPEQLKKVLATLEKIRSEFNGEISMADLIVLAGNAAIEEAARRAGVVVKVPFTPGRVDATQEMTDTEFWKIAEPRADGFRNYHTPKCMMSPEEALIDKAHLLTLTAPEMAVLIGGLRVLGANYNHMEHGMFTQNPGKLTNDFFVNLLSMDVEWHRSGNNEFLGINRANGEIIWKATSVDLIFGANSQLRAISEVYASDDAKEKFVHDFIAAWHKVMNLDRFDMKNAID